MPQSHSVISGRHHDAPNILQADRDPVGTVRQVRVIERTGAIIFHVGNKIQTCIQQVRKVLSENIRKRCMLPNKSIVSTVPFLIVGSLYTKLAVLLISISDPIYYGDVPQCPVFRLKDLL